MHSAMTNQPAVSIIIPTWNSSAHIQHCLAHLSAQTFKQFEIILVDNGSPDFQAGSLSKQWLALRIREIALEQNRGFAAASNLGAQAARGEWLAFLNADAYPEPGWLEEFMRGLQNFPHAGAFGSLILQHDHPNLVDSAGDIYGSNGLAWKGYANYPVDVVPAEAVRIFSPCAAAAFYRRDIFFEIGGFDEDFFSYLEDVDLGFRLNLYSYVCLVLPEARVRHVGSASTSKNSDFALYHHQRNLTWVYVKNMPGFLFWLYLPLHLITKPIVLLKSIRDGRGKIIFKATIDALKCSGKILDKRKKIQKERRASLQEINRLLNRDLLAPYTIGRRLRRYHRQQESQVQHFHK